MVIAIVSLLIATCCCQRYSRRASTARRGQCANNLKQIGIALHNYHDARRVFPPGYVDNNLDSTSTPDNDMGPGWGWAAYLLPFVEEENTYAQINFNVPVGTGTNTTVSQQAIVAYQCPTDPLQQSFGLYESSFGAIIATVAHSNYVGCNGWVECFGNAGGNYQPAKDPGQLHEDGDGLGSGTGMAGNGLFYRNSKNNTGKVTDGLSKTIIVGERSSDHSPSTWTGAVAKARTPAWMAGQDPYSSPPGPAFDNADYGEALVLAHGNATHVPSVDFPIFDPDTFYSEHAGKGANFVFGDGSVQFLTQEIDGHVYQNYCTIAGGEITESLGSP